MSTLAIIPARGGSKSIPRKNIKPLCGKPLIGWSIETALATKSVNRVVVSTDDNEIANIARQFGAEVIMRPSEISGDLATSEAALLHVLDTLRQTEAYHPEIIAFLQATSPLTISEDIDGSIRLVIEEGYDSVVTMTPFHHFIWRENNQGSMEGVNHLTTRRLMRQEKTPEYLEVGAVYVMRTNGFLKNRFRFFGQIGKYIIPTYRAIEIDTPDDWMQAEALMRSINKTRQLSNKKLQLLSQIKAVVTDFDGVMTDNKVYVDQNGKESVVCSRGDGWGISLLKKEGIVVACISTEENPVVRARCEKLKIPYWQGQHDKLSTFKAFLAQYDIPAEQCIYVGNDTNDAACLEFAGLAVVPRDAVVEITHLADWQTQSTGGNGVLREIASGIIAERSKTYG